MRYRAGKTDLTNYSSFVIRLKGDGKDYQFRAKTSSSDYYSYINYFSTNGKWQSIEIPFNSLYPSFRGRKLDSGNFPGEILEEIGFLIGNNKAEDFMLLIDKIELK